MLGTILQGLRVVDLTQNVAGPYCTQILADLGAEVVKIERPGSGDDARAWRPPEVGGMSTGFAALNRSKKSVAVDLDRPEGQRLVAQMAGGADVLVHSLKPGSAESRGLGDDALRESNPGLVYCAISAFGEVGPMAGLPGYDPLMQAFTGIMSVTGHEGDEPARVGVSLVDMGTGMWATMAILAALLQRAATGRGMRVGASLLETGMAWMAVPIANYLATGKLPRKMGSGMAMMVPYELYDTVDGKIFIAAANDRLFARICTALGCPGLAIDPRFADNPARVGHREALHAALEAHTRSRTTAECVERLRAAGAPCSELHNVGQLLEQEQVRALEVLMPVPLPEAPSHRTVGLPFNSGGLRGRLPSAPPRLGADTDAVLGEMGLDPAQLDALRKRGVIG
ncbi:CaiB/BaiF CoA transferase family protein [Ramlibacter albus]|uniref:CoA transferase n=1 Tax=Ramlibacter albus TaxID=2079448 RepID=A0A923M2T0_9BURK|nr:CoA transferase [Ramlibacter albus]MBC5762873.1 CoA transferase [Ramlibacter albus]